MNKNASLVSFVIVHLMLLSSCGNTKSSGTKKLPGKWQATPISIDGSNKDWPAPHPEYDDKAQLGYAVTNDKDNLYITVETGDLATQLKILRTGLTVWIDKTGEKNQLTAINYPIPQTGTEKIPKPMWGQSNDPDQQRIELEDRVRAAMTMANEYSLQGFKGCNLQYPVTETDTCGITVRMAIDTDNELVWEAKIPFKSFYFKPETDKRDKGRALSICIQTEAMKRPAAQPVQNNAGNTRGGGLRPSIGIGGMGMGVNMGGNRGGQTRNAPQRTTNYMEPMYKASVTWKKFGIAFQ